jgi:hypothetical protein
LGKAGLRLEGLIAVVLTVAAVLAACESAPTPAPATTAVSSPPVVTAPPPPPPPAVAAGPISLPPPGPVSRDTCGADLLQGLIGRPRTEIPVPVDPSKRRVVCTNCPRTMDLRPDRQTIEYNPENGAVTSVTCG